MRIVGIQNQTSPQITAHVQAGARFVIFQYCISILVMTFKRNSDVYFILPGESALPRGLPFIVCSLLLGWWGIPWGPIWTISTVFRNIRGGIDVTAAVVQGLNSQGPGRPGGAA